MNSTLRVAISCFAVSYLVAIVLLGELLGSTADSTSTFTDYFESNAARASTIIACLLLVAASGLCAACGMLLRAALAATSNVWLEIQSSTATLAGSGLLVSGGLLLAAPLLLALGDATGDGELEPIVVATVAQAGSVVLLATLLVLGAWTVLVATIAWRAGQIATWFFIVGLVVALFAVLGITVGAALPLGAWWVATVFLLRAKDRSPA